MSRHLASPLGRLVVSIIAVTLCVVLARPAKALTANMSARLSAEPATETAPITAESVCTGVLHLAENSCTGLFCADNPVNRIDPSGHDGEMSSLVTTMGQIGYMAGRTFAAVSNMRWMAYARLTPVIEKAWQAAFWADVAVTAAGVGAAVAPEVLNLAADLGTRINRAYTLNTVAIPTAPGGPSGYGVTIENIGGQQLEAMGGTYLGGNVKGIDGTLGVGPGNVLVSFKAHDVADENLIQTIGNDMRNFAALDPAEIQGTANSGQRFPPPGGLGSVAGRIKVIAVPQRQIQYVISPQFINAMRQLAEETKTVPIVRAVRNWPGRSR